MNQIVPCWLCGKSQDLRITKGGKYYIVCDPCGLQCFIRRNPGMEKLKILIKHFAQKKYQVEKHTENLFVIQEILREIEGLKQEIANLEDQEDFFFPDDNSIQARKALQKRVNLLLAQLEHLAMHERNAKEL